MEARGHDLSGALWSARILSDAPDEIRSVHRSYVRAGARVLVTASYQVSAEGYVDQGRDAREADEALRASVRLAREASEDADVLVAASVGPFGAITHDGGEYRGRYGIPHRDLVGFHRRRLDVLADAGPDLLAVETIPDVDEVHAVVECLADYPHLPAWITVSCADSATTCAGQPVESAARAASAAPTVAAIGVNCSSPDIVGDVLRRMAGASDLPLVAYPNSGRGWDSVTGWSGTGVAIPDDEVTAWASRAALIGGCCGVGPADIARMAGLMSAYSAAPRQV